MIGDDARSISEALSRARDQGFDVVVWHLYGRSPPHITHGRMSGYVLSRIVSNQSHALAIYELKDKSATPATQPALLPANDQENTTTD